MANNTMKLLAATALLAGVSGAALADSITSGTTVTTQTTEGTTAGLEISNSALISVSGTAAINISDTSNINNVLTVGVDATVQSTATSGTVQSLALGTGRLVSSTINNSGTIAAIGGSTVAISTSNVWGNVALTNTGTISGSVTLGSGTNVIVNTGGTITGNVSTSTGVDTLTVEEEATITGNVNLEAGADVMTVDDSSIIGNIDMGADNNDNLTLINAVVSGTISGGAGSGDSLNISGTSTNAFTTRGVISGMENLNVSNTTVHLLNGSDNGIDQLRIENGTMNVSNTNLTLATGGDITVNGGTLNIAAGKVVSATTATFTNGGVLGIHVSDSTTAGQLALIAGSDAAFTGVSTTIHLGANAGYINSGTEYLIVRSNDNAVALLPSLTTTTQGLYTFQVSNSGASNQEVSLTIYRAATNTAGENAGNIAIANVLDSISSTTNAQLLEVQQAITAQTTLAGVNDVLESLNPAGGTGAAMANVNTNVAVGNQVSDRLAMLRGGQAGMNTGDGMFSNHFWVQGYGNITDQDAKDGVAGYDANTAGMSFGVDSDSVIDGATAGLAFSYGASNVESDAAGNANTDINSYLLTGYASTMYDTGVFLNGQVSLGLNDYETSRNVIGVGTASGDFDGIQYGAKVEVGRDYDYAGWILTPMASAQYTHVDMDGYTETGAGGANLVVNDTDFDALDLGLGAQVAWPMPLENGGTFKPAVRAKYIYRAGDDSVETNSRFVGGGGAFTTQGVEADRSSLNLGAGVMLSTVGGVDLSLDYDADIRNSLTGHTGQVKARWAF